MAVRLVHYHSPLVQAHLSDPQDQVFQGFLEGQPDPSYQLDPPDQIHPDSETHKTIKTNAVRFV